MTPTILFAVTLIVLAILAAANRRRRRSEDPQPDRAFSVLHNGDVELVEHPALQQLGAQPGDVLVSVAGIQPRSPLSAVAAARGAKRVIVSRRGQILALPPEQWETLDRQDELLSAATSAFLADPSRFARHNPAYGRSHVEVQGLTVLPH